MQRQGGGPSTDVAPHDHRPHSGHLALALPRDTSDLCSCACARQGRGSGLGAALPGTAVGAGGGLGPRPQLRVRGHPGQAERHGGQGSRTRRPFRTVCIGADALQESPPGTSRRLATGRLGGTGTSARGQECLVLACAGRGRPRSSRGRERGLWPARAPSFPEARRLGSRKAGSPESPTSRLEEGGRAGGGRPHGGVWRGRADKPVRQGSAALQPCPRPRSLGLGHSTRHPG